MKVRCIEIHSAQMSSNVMLLYIKIGIMGVIEDLNFLISVPELWQMKVKLQQFFFRHFSTIKLSACTHSLQSMTSQTRPIKIC
jgi:hypothetical protein